MSELTVGQVIAGKFRVDRILGQGGMGYVVLAHHIQFEDRVALKLLLPELAKNAEVVERFVREGRAARKIRGDHVVEVSDVGQTEDGVPFMVMEYLDGQDLQHELKARGPLPVDEAIDFVLQACEALVEAHAMGIVHRDLKPANLFLTRRRDGSPCVKVLDFGISKMKSGDDRTSALTRTTGMMGTVLYMSPEQLQSAKDVDARSDVWAVGSILYELLTARVPFIGEDIPQTCVQIMLGPTPSVRALRLDVPEGVDAAIGRCLEKNREARMASVAELAVMLAPFAPARARLSLDRIAGVARAHVDDLARASGLPSAPEGNSPTALWSPATAAPGAVVGAVSVASTAAPPGLSTTAGSSASRDVEATAVPVGRSKAPLLAAAAGLVVIAIGGATYALRTGGGSARPPNGGQAAAQGGERERDRSAERAPVSSSTAVAASESAPSASAKAPPSASIAPRASVVPVAPATKNASPIAATASAKVTAPTVKAPSAYDE